MGQIQSKRQMDQSTGAVANLESIASSIYTPGSNQESVILFTKNLTSDPCALLGKNLVEVANLLAKSDGISAFAVSAGPCPGCNSPVFYYWSQGGWKNFPLGSVIHFLTILQNNVINGGFGAVYQLSADKDLKITNISSAYSYQNNIFTLAPSCVQTALVAPVAPVAPEAPVASVVPVAPTSQQSMQQQSTSSGWNVLLWIIVIILIILLIWFFIRQSSRHT